MSSVEIRPAGPQDVAAIASLYVANWQSTYRGLLPDEFLDGMNAESAGREWSGFMRGGKNIIYVACDGDTLLGFTACEPDEKSADRLYLHSLHVSDKARGRGVGTGLIRRVWSRAQELGLTGVSVCIVRGNENARRLYTHLGAEHLEFFTDEMDGATSSSERLLWTLPPKSES